MYRMGGPTWGALLTLALTSTSGWGQEAASIHTTIARAWKEREERVVTVNCEWTAEHVTGAKTWNYREKNGEEFALPPTDLTVRCEYRFRLKGKKMRYEYAGPQPNQETRSFQRREYVSVTDGKDQKCYYGKDEASDKPRFPPLGFVNVKDTLPEETCIHLRPLLLLYRPSTPVVAEVVNLPAFSPKGSVSFGGRECLLMERRRGADEKHELVLDMKRGCAPVRFRKMIQDESTGNWRVSFLVEIEYVDESNGKWKPRGWKTALFGSHGRLCEQMSAATTEFATNADVPDTVFQFDFPVGTIVRNWKTGAHYLLREGGEKRIITDAESDARVPYDRLLITNSGESLEGSSRAWSIFSIVIKVLLFLLVIGGLVYARRLGRKSHATTA
jgi:outer membrane lipoprotein-sorting protein